MLCTTAAPALPRHLLDIRTILLEPEAEGFARGREILARFPHAERIPVASHWRVALAHPRAARRRR